MCYCWLLIGGLQQNGNNYQVSYTPTEPGVYYVHVTYDGGNSLLVLSFVLWYLS